MPPTWLHWPAAPWAPSDLADLRAWYDADDSSTITESGGDISQWDDKSGGGYHLSQATAANQPTYTSAGLNSKNVVTFNGTHWMAASTASDWTFLHDVAGSTVLAVWKAGTSSNPGGGSATQYGLLSTQSSLALANIGSSVTYRNNQTPGVTDSVGHFISNNGSQWASVNISGSNEHSANAATIVAAVGDPANGTLANRSTVRVNGGSAINNSTAAGSAPTPPIAPSAALHVGATGSNNLLEGFIAEIVICDAILSSTDREKVEGYLAWKWGLEGNLPNGHPYKNAAP